MRSLFPIAYLPPTGYLLECKKADAILIEQHEHFVKQTIRNRCEIYGPNGKQMLVIPVVHENLFRTPVNKVRISYSERWNKIHWRSICAAYRNAPFFEFYEDEFASVFNHPGEYLFEFNLKLLKIIFRIFSISDFEVTTEFNKIVTNTRDLRNAAFQSDQLAKYRQVFEERHGFIENLSAIDWVMNNRSR